MEDWDADLSPCALVSSYPLNLGGDISRLDSGGGVSETPCFTAFCEGPPLNLGGEMSPPKFKGNGFSRNLEL